MYNTHPLLDYQSLTVITHSALAWFITIPNRRDTKINMKHTIPLVQQRIHDMNRKLQDPSYRYEEPVSLRIVPKYYIDTDIFILI
jgi:hypothetical protein